MTCVAIPNPHFPPGDDASRRPTSCSARSTELTPAIVAGRWRASSSGASLGADLRSGAVVLEGRPRSGRSPSRPRSGSRSRTRVSPPCRRCRCRVPTVGSTPGPRRRPGRAAGRRRGSRRRCRRSACRRRRCRRGSRSPLSPLTVSGPVPPKSLSSPLPPETVSAPTLPVAKSSPLPASIDVVAGLAEDLVVVVAAVDRVVAAGRGRVCRTTLRSSPKILSFAVVPVDRVVAEAAADQVVAAAAVDLSFPGLPTMTSSPPVPDDRPGARDRGVARRRTAACRSRPTMIGSWSDER